MSASHSWLGVLAVKCRLTRSSWTGGPGFLPFFPAPLAERAPPAVVRTDPPNRPVARCVACVAGFVGEVPVPELGVVAVGVEQRVGQVRLLELGVGDRADEPAVVG